MSSTSYPLRDGAQIPWIMKTVCSVSLCWLEGTQAGARKQTERRRLFILRIFRCWPFAEEGGKGEHVFAHWSKNTCVHTRTLFGEDLWQLTSFFLLFLFAFFFFCLLFLFSTKMFWSLAESHSLPTKIRDRLTFESAGSNLVLSLCENLLKIWWKKTFSNFTSNKRAIDKLLIVRHRCHQS